MKRSIYWFNLFTVALILTVGAAGCKKKVKGPTPIPGGRGAGLTDSGTYPPENVGTRGVGEGATTGQPITDPNAVLPQKGRFDPANFDPDPGPLASYTVYFDYDRSAVKSSETSKVEAVASYLKGNPGVGVQVEGHCDQRGTEQYNLSLGERRALALREYLANLGIEGDRVLTISYGEDRPADPGNNEAAWSKNRRGAFIVLRPKQ